MDYQNMITLDRQKIGQQVLVSPEVLETAFASTEIDRITNDLVIRAGLYVLSQKLLDRTQTQTLRFPANPWQHVKDRFGPGWFTARWPVRYREVTVTFHVDVDAMYPQARIVADNPVMGVPVFHEHGVMDVVLDGAPWPVAPELSSLRRDPSPITYEQARHQADMILRTQPPWYR